MRWRWFELFIGLAVIAYLLVGLLNLLREPRPVPVSVEAVKDSVRFADTTAQFYEIGDSVFIRCRFVPHGRGVIVEIQPVKVKTRR